MFLSKTYGSRGDPRIGGGPWGLRAPPRSATDVFTLPLFPLPGRVIILRMALILAISSGPGNNLRPPLTSQNSGVADVSLTSIR